MAEFHPLKVVDIRRDTRDSVILTLEPPESKRDEFRFIQGQYLTFRREFDGEELRRCYSICAGRSDGVLRVGIKKVDDGWFSGWANDHVKVGMTLEAMRPMGNFHTPIDPLSARRYLGFAGGSGITPLISLIRTVLVEEPKSSFTLVYGNRAANAVMFREELEDLKNAHINRLNVVHVLESEAPETELFSGRLDLEKCQALFERWIDVKSADYAFICGPEPMMLAVAAALRARGVAEEKIKFELFASAKRGKSKREGAARAAARDARAEVTVVMDGARRQFSMPKSGESVLEAALAASIDAPYACKAGVCSTCRAKIVEGEVEMETNYSLEDYEVRRGYILTCQSRPTTDRIVIDYDQ
jgi:ring-1,2-phenylacetyl-CoA epoxidase subunit PaaE